MMLCKDMVPKTLGRFEIIEELDRGAMGVVYKGIDPKIERTIALKVINFHDAEEGSEMQTRERLMVEAQAAGQLASPNILTIFDVGEEDKVSFIAMELVEGGTLKEMIEKQAFQDYNQIIGITRQIAEGLEEAHQKGIIHRDIKPANILMYDAHTPKIADFGLARFPNSNITNSGIVLGTPHYMAPEQVKGVKADERSDLFALGLVFYEMLTGSQAFSGENYASILYRVVHEEPVPPRQIVSSLPEGMDQFMKKALAKDPDERFQSAQELIKGLEQLQGEIPFEGYNCEKETKIVGAPTRTETELPCTPSGKGKRVGAIALFLSILVLNLVGDAGKGNAPFAQITHQIQSSPGMKTKASKRETTFPLHRFAQATKISWEMKIAAKLLKPIELCIDPNLYVATSSTDLKQQSSQDKVQIAKLDFKPTKTKPTKKRVSRKSRKPEKKNETQSTLAKKTEIYRKKISTTRTILTSNLSVNSTPEGAMLYVNGELMGETPYLNLKHQQETLTLRVSKAGFKDYQKTFTLKEDRIFHVSLKMASGPKKKKGFWAKIFNPDEGRILIKVKKGDKIVVDGKYYKPNRVASLRKKGSSQPNRSREVEVATSTGKHNIYVIRQGSKPFLQTVHLKKGETLEVTAKFPG